MSRECLHLTVAAVVCFQNKYLLVEEIDKLSGQRVLNQPAGHVEQDEDLLQAIARELFEETGLALTPSSWLGISQLHASNGHRYVRVNFVFEPTELPKLYAPQDADILKLHWYSASEIAAATIPLRSQLVADAIQLFEQGIRLPLNLIQPTR